MKNKSNKVNKNLFYIIPVLCLLVIGALGVLVVQPKIAEIQDLNSKKEAEEAKRSKMTQKLQVLKGLEADKLNLQSKLVALNVALPSEKDASGLFIHLQKIAQASEVEIQSISFAPGKIEANPNTKTGLEIPITLSLKGNFEAIKIFLGYAYTAKRLINLETLSLSYSQNDDGSVTSNTNVTAFYQPKAEIPKDETEALPNVTQADEEIMRKIEEYKTYQN